MSYKILFTRQAVKDLEKIKKSNLNGKVYKLLEILSTNPMQPPWEKLIDQENTYSRRINLQHRLVYMIDEENKEIRILRAWTHYGDN